MKQNKELYLLLDANFNRAREGLRVCEDIERFVRRSKKHVSDARRLRHRITGVMKELPTKQIIASRLVGEDFGKKPHILEQGRKNWSDLFSANIQRTKEALRVLEEVTKLVNLKSSQKIKRIRFETYAYEKESAQKI